MSKDMSHDPKEWCKVKKKWLVASKLTQGIWLIFIRAVASLKFCTLMCSFCPYHIKFWMKKYRRFMSHDTEEWCKVWRTLTLGSKNDITNLVNFNESSGKSENLLSDVPLPLKAYSIWDKIVQGSFVS